MSTFRAFAAPLSPNWHWRNSSACNTETSTRVPPKPRLGVDQQALEGAYGADAQRAEKRRAIELHVRALEHAAACPGCERKACAKMAGYLRHAASCTQGAACLDCRRIDTLVQLHARRCTLDLCRVPGCVSLRERLRVESWKAALEG